MEEKKYTLKECKAFNQEKQARTTEFIQVNYPNAESKALIIPEGAHPWNILHTVIGRFYEREIEVARLVDAVKNSEQRAEKLYDVTEKAWNRSIEGYKELCERNKRLIDENAELKESTAHRQDADSEFEASTDELIDSAAKLAFAALIDLARQECLTGWVTNMGTVLDDLIFATNASEGIGFGDSLYYVRTLQKFFIELQETGISRYLN